MQFSPDDVGLAQFYQRLTPEQLSFYPEAYYAGLAQQLDHTIQIIAEHDKQLLDSVEPARLVQRQQALQPYRRLREEKEMQGKFTWTLGLYPTEAMAQDVGLSIEEYWEQIVAACFLDQPDPVSKWREVAEELEQTRTWLNSLAIDELHITGPDADLRVGVGPGRVWLGGSGRNIPSFELFTSPDYRRTEGWIRFNQPLYSHGRVVQGIELRFDGGVVTDTKAGSGLDFLQGLLSTPGGNRLGEVSLTDRRLSRITHVMGETLYDENLGGANGNTHVAIGSAYRDAYPEQQPTLSDAEWDKLGYNSSAIHNDLISTAPRTVTATLQDGTTTVIYQDGMFTGPAPALGK
jgi:aminopeptidase